MIWNWKVIRAPTTCWYLELSRIVIICTCFTFHDKERSTVSVHEHGKYGAHTPIVAYIRNLAGITVIL